MARRVDGDFGEGVVLDTLDNGAHLITWNEEDSAAKLDASELMPFGSGMGSGSERRQRVAPAFILNNFLMKTAIPSNDLSRVQMVVRDGADVNCTDGEGNSPLILAVTNAASVALVQFLVSRGAHVNFVGATGSALQVASTQNNVEMVRCLLAHGANAGIVDLKVCAKECAKLLKETLTEAEMAQGESSNTPLDEAERSKYSEKCFVKLLPPMLAALGNAQSPKVHKRVLMVVNYVVQRATESKLSALSALQLGALIGSLRVLLSSAQTLEQFSALRMLVAALRAWPLVGSVARRHGLEAQLDKLSKLASEPVQEIEEPPPPAESLDGSQDSDSMPMLMGGSAGVGGQSARARSVSLKPADVAALASHALELLRAAPVTADEQTPLRSLAQLPALAQQSFGGAMKELAALLVGEQAPSAHELQQSGTLSWLLSELGRSDASELRLRWADFERAFGTQPGAAGGAALAQLLQLLHNSLIASEQLPVHSYANANEGAHSLKSLAEPLTICLHPLQKPEGTADQIPPPHQLSIDSLVRVEQLKQQLLRTSHIASPSYEAFCTRLLGCVMEERPISKPDEPFRRATVTHMRTATPLKLLLHTLRYDDGRSAEVLMIARSYRLVGRVPKEQLCEAGKATSTANADAVCDPDARIHTVNITCPEGLPVEFFLENVLSEVRRALRQADPGFAPMTRSVNDDFGWRDRGWDRGGSHFERTITEKLRANGVAAVARRQTKHEAETLVNRLQNNVMVGMETERESTTGESTTGGSDAESEGGDRLPLLSRVQGLVAADPNAGGAAQWLGATVVETGAGGISLVFDLGGFEASVPAYRVRPVPQPESNKRLNPLAAIFMTFEQFLSNAEERRAEAEHSSRETMPANLRRSFSAFNMGRGHNVGRVSAAALDGDGNDESEAADAQPMELAGEGSQPGDLPPSPTQLSATDTERQAAPFDIASMKLQVRLGLVEESKRPTEPGVCFDEADTLLFCLQQLRETSAMGRALVPRELGFHPGVSCDRSGQNPIIGNRYKLRNENYDVCEAEYLLMEPSERAKYSKIEPPCFRKPKGCGPAVWHLWYSIEVEGEGASDPESHGRRESMASTISSTISSPPPQLTPAERRLSSTLSGGSSGRGSLSGASTLPWSVADVEEGLVSGRLEAAAVVRELHRASSCVEETRLSEQASTLLTCIKADDCGNPPRAAPFTTVMLMSAYREVADAPRAVALHSAPLPSPHALASLEEELERRGMGREECGDFSQALMVLWLLSQRMSGANDARAEMALGHLSEAGREESPASASTSGASSAAQGASTMDASSTTALASLQSLLVSPRLSAKLQQQLADALAVSSGALPQWCQLLLRRFPELFSPESRAQWFRSSAFGVSRGLHWSQEEQVAAMRSAYAEELAALERKRLEAEVSNDQQSLAEALEELSEIEDRVGRDRLGALKSDIARVPRDQLLPAAERLMALHATSRALLEVQFEGESGFGTGVTQNFYSAVANELLKANVQAALPIWMAETAGAAEDGFIQYPTGALFPMPLSSSAPASHCTAVCERFRFLGRLMAKACRDNFIVPLPLSRDFLHLVRGGSLSYASLPPLGSTGGVASGYAAVALRLAAVDKQAASEAQRRKLYEQVADEEFASSHMRMSSRLSLREWLAAGDCCFVCPVTGHKLCQGGEQRELSVHNLPEYMHLLSQFWLCDGVAAQAEAFRAGLEEVFPPSMLEPFSLHELQTLLCGTMRIEWTEAELQRHIHPTGGYTKHSKVYQLLLDELQRMGNAERRHFLNFVTACPHLPPVGLSMLEIEVLPQTSGSQLPTAQTCGNKLYLPDYTEAAMLNAGLAEAFANAEFGGLHEGLGRAS